MEEFTGYAIVADLRAGSNVVADAVPELYLGDGLGGGSVAGVQWDADPGDGFDSGWRTVELTVLASGGTGSVFLSLGGGETQVAYAGDAYESLWGAVLRAGSLGDGRTLSLRNISAAFYAGETDQTAAETAVAEDVAASTDGSTTGEAEAIVLAVPEGTGYQKLTVFCEVRMEAPTAPDPGDLFGQVFVYAG